MNFEDIGNDIAGILLIVALWLAGSGLYFAPTITAFMTKSRNIGVVAVINLIFGWTVLGWVVALVFAIWVDKKPAGWMPQQPWPQPYPYGPPPQQQWPTQPPMWHTQPQAAPYDYPTDPGSQQRIPYNTADDQLGERRRRHTP